MGEPNKPDFGPLEKWARYIACDEDGMWFQYAQKPLAKDIYTLDAFGKKFHKWSNSGGGLFLSCGAVADEDWAKQNWKSSVEKIPDHEVQSEDHFQKPGWDTAPDWANFLACDKDGEWYWYAQKPDLSVSSEVWSCPYGDVESVPYEYTNPKWAKEKWAEENWQDSLEEKPDSLKAKSSSASDEYKQNGLGSHQRVTLFIDFDADADDIDLASIITAAVKNRLDKDRMINGVDEASVTRVRVAVGTIKTHEIVWDDSDEKYIFIGSDTYPDEIAF